jgi:hypothetical protein
VTTFDVVDTYGAKALARFVGAGAVFLLLHFLRWLLLLAVRVLDVQMRRVDAYATRQANPVILTTTRPRTRTDTRGEYRGYANTYAYAP